MSAYHIPVLPLQLDVESKAILRQLALVHRRLGELKGVVHTIPNERIIINTLTLQEAKDSSAIENIITTQDELFKAELYVEGAISVSTKEVQNYANALRKGFESVRKNKLLSLQEILLIQEELEEERGGLRKLPGTVLKNASTQETIYVPPAPHLLPDLMSNLVDYINNDNLSDVDPLIKMAIIHHQFESIHPFYDGNGRTGRIINILYLVIKDLLNLPILYLSRYIIQHKNNYYRLLQQVRDRHDWEAWIMFMLKGVEITAVQSIYLVQKIRSLMQEYKDILRRHSTFYSQDLLNNLFRHPYTKIEFLMEELDISRPTAQRYLEELVELRLLAKRKIWKTNYYINIELSKLLIRHADSSTNS